MANLEGSCHCGRVKVILRTARATAELPLRVCGCGFCRRHRPRYTSDPAGRVEIASDAASNLTRYRFGTKTADFLICTGCGTYIGAACEIDGAPYAVLNVNILDAAGEFTQPTTTLEAEGETTAARLARRARNWTPATLR